MTSPVDPARGARYWPPFADLSRDRQEPFVLTHGEGSYVYDRAGRSYLDATASLWYVLVGHGRQELADAAGAQMGQLAAYYTHGDFANVPALTLAERVCGLAPLNDPLVLFNSGGGDAIDSAAKLARRYWGVLGRPDKSLLLHRELAYHGMQGLGTGLAGIEPLRSGYGASSFPEFEPLPHDDAQALEDRILAVGPDRVAAFFAEPVIGAGGVYPPTADYFAEVGRICRRYDVLLIADEVVTAFGRLGSWFASPAYGLEPDIICIAKGITSGYMQLGGVLASRRVWEPIAAGGTASMFRHGYTYAGHPTACAVALANMDIIEREGLLDRSVQMAGPFDAAVRELEGHVAVRGVRAAGLMAGIDLDGEALGGDFAQRVFRRARELGVLVRVMFGGQTLQVSPPLVIGDGELRRLHEILAQALDDCMADPAAGHR